MFNIGGGEMLAILLLALLVLGPERLPKAMGQVGHYVAQLRRMSSGFQEEIKRAMDPGDAPFRPGEERLSGPPGAIDDEVRVVGGDAGDDGIIDTSATDDGRDGATSETDDSVEGASDDPAIDPDRPASGPVDADDEAVPGSHGEAASDPGGDGGNVTPLRPRDDDGDARAAG